MRAPRRLALLGATTALLLSSAGIAAADDIYNDLDPTIDAAVELMPLNVGGPDGTTTLAVKATNDDEKSGCNLTGNVGDLVVDVVSSDPAVATVAPSRITFDACGDTPKLTVTPGVAGEATISLVQISNASQGDFDLRPATFSVNVTGASNTAPLVKVTGVTHGASYAKGSVPDAMCEVTDAEDGEKSFAATLSEITGPYAADGIGTQTATCEYTDDGGLKAVATATYSIVDPTAPSISYTLDPAEPNGDNDWYASDVSLTWHVTEPESPSSLEKTGCVDTTVTSDQQATTYTCSATSAGGRV